jgi:hypothetical protein
MKPMEEMLQQVPIAFILMLSSHLLVAYLQMMLDMESAHQVGGYERISHYPPITYLTVPSSAWSSPTNV